MLRMRLKKKAPEKQNINTRTNKSTVESDNRKNLVLSRKMVYNFLMYNITIFLRRLNNKKYIYKLLCIFTVVFA